MPFYTGGVNLNDFYFTDEDIVNKYVSMDIYTLIIPFVVPEDAFTTVPDSMRLVDADFATPEIAGAGNDLPRTICIKSDGTLWHIGPTYSWMGYAAPSPVTNPVGVSVGSNWKKISIAYGGNPGFVITALKTDNTLWTWGRNIYGALGRPSTYYTERYPAMIEGSWSEVASGTWGGAAIRTDGTLWTWGQNTYGQLGDNTTVDQGSPVQTISGGTWSKVRCGDSYKIAIKTDGTLWSWGQNNYGQLGDGTVVNRSSPVQIVSGGTNWAKLAGGQSYRTYHEAAIKSDGTLWTWGKNNHPFGGGQLGDNTTTAKSSPVQIAGNTWKQVTAASGVTAAIKTDGALWYWGYGQFVRGYTTYFPSSPVQLLSSSNVKWKKVEAGYGGSNYSLFAIGTKG